jgi:hypothetical protein
VHPNAIAESGVDARLRLVNVPTAQGNQSNRKLTCILLGEIMAGLRHEPSATVNPKRARSVYEDVGHRWISHELRESTKRSGARSPRRQSGR